MKGYTDYPITLEEFGFGSDNKDQPAEIRELEIMHYDGIQRCTVRIVGMDDWIQLEANKIYKEYGRSQENITNYSHEELMEKRTKPPNKDEFRSSTNKLFLDKGFAIQFESNTYHSMIFAIVEAEEAALRACKELHKGMQAINDNWQFKAIPVFCTYYETCSPNKVIEVCKLRMLELGIVRS
jgi:hypothetical protein